MGKLIRVNNILIYYMIGMSGFNRLANLTNTIFDTINDDSNYDNKLKHAGLSTNIGNTTIVFENGFNVTRGLVDLTNSVLEGVSLSNLDNVDISGPNNGDILLYNGNIWVSAPPSGGDSPSDVFNSTATFKEGFNVTGPVRFLPQPNFEKIISINNGTNSGEIQWTNLSNGKLFSSIAMNDGNHDLAIKYYSDVIITPLSGDGRSHNFNITGNTTLYDNLNVVGDSNFTGCATFNSDIIVAGDSNFTGCARFEKGYSIVDGNQTNSGKVEFGTTFKKGFNVTDGECDFGSNTIVRPINLNVRGLGDSGVARERNGLLTAGCITNGFGSHLNYIGRPDENANWNVRGSSIKFGTGGTGGNPLTDYYFGSPMNPFIQTGVTISTDSYAVNNALCVGGDVIVGIPQKFIADSRFVGGCSTRLDTIPEIRPGANSYIGGLRVAGKLVCQRNPQKNGQTSRSIFLRNNKLKGNATQNRRAINPNDGTNVTNWQDDHFSWPGLINDSDYSKLIDGGEWGVNTIANPITETGELAGMAAGLFNEEFAVGAIFDNGVIIQDKLEVKSFRLPSQIGENTIHTIIDPYGVDGQDIAFEPTSFYYINNTTTFESSKINLGEGALLFNIANFNVNVTNTTLGPSMLANCTFDITPPLPSESFNKRRCIIKNFKNNTIKQGNATTNNIARSGQNDSILNYIDGDIDVSNITASTCQGQIVISKQLRDTILQDQDNTTAAMSQGGLNQTWKFDTKTRPELIADKTLNITNITRSGSVFTINTSKPHNIKNGDTILIKGINSQYVHQTNNLTQSNATLYNGIVNSAYPISNLTTLSTVYDLIRGFSILNGPQQALTDNSNHRIDIVKYIDIDEERATQDAISNITYDGNLFGGDVIAVPSDFSASVNPAGAPRTSKIFEGAPIIPKLKAYTTSNKTNTGPWSNGAVEADTNFIGSDTTLDFRRHCLPGFTYRSNISFNDTDPNDDNIHRNNITQVMHNHLEDLEHFYPEDGIFNLSINNRNLNLDRNNPFYFQYTDPTNTNKKTIFEDEKNSSFIPKLQSWSDTNTTNKANPTGREDGLPYFRYFTKESIDYAHDRWNTTVGDVDPANGGNRGFNERVTKYTNFLEHRLIDITSQLNALTRYIVEVIGPNLDKVVSQR